MDLSKVPFEPFYQADGITLYNADCLQVLPFLPQFDLLLTDPPYGIKADRDRNSTRHAWKRYPKTNWDSQRPSRLHFEAMRDRAKIQMIWGGNYFIDYLSPSMQWLIWDKGQRRFSLADCEMCWTNQKKATRVFDFPRSRVRLDGKYHPTQKPVALMEWCIGHAKGCQSILDPFCGSGSTLIAARLIGLDAVGVEVSRLYCKTIAERISSMQ